MLQTQRLAPEDGGKPDVLAIFRQQYATFADEPLAALEGRTPRAAAADPALRPRLVALTKTHIRDTDRRRRAEQFDLDLNPLLAELGLLRERLFCVLIQPVPPPSRAAAAPRSNVTHAAVEWAGSNPSRLRFELKLATVFATSQ